MSKGLTCTECGRNIKSLSGEALADALKRWGGKCPPCAGSSIATFQPFLTPPSKVAKQ